MKTKFAENFDRIIKSINKIEYLPKTLIKYGCYISSILFIIGAILVLLNNTLLPYDHYFEMVSQSIVKTSLTLAAETIIGGLVMDFVFKKG